MGQLPNEDVQHVGRVVAQRTDLSQQQAEQRVREVFMNMQSTLNEAETQAREAADAAREASAYAALWLFISLLAGAFIASWMATFGGRQRDL
jgi:CHASE3 domain sensor protein